MDDYLDSHDSIVEAAQIAADIVIGAACLEMRAWTSNVQAALDLVPSELRAVQPSEVVDLGSDSTTIKVLGIAWDPTTDNLGFRTGLDGSLPHSLTKRKALTHLMRVYDPLGLLGPIIVKGRILFQQLWRTNIDWDTPFPPSITLKWNEWFKELSDIATIKVPRWYAREVGEPAHRELHLFADASELAYASVAYWRLLYPDGTVKLSLIASKARVASLKPISIPRLELQAALIASRLAVSIIDHHKKKPSRSFFWTDSKTVLGWLRSDARSFKPFVAHRIGEITENTCVQDWRWVPTDLNVSDDATRMKPLNLNSDHRWFSGPAFLLKLPEDWPLESTPVTPVREELKSSEFVSLVHASVISPIPVTADFSHFSDWLRLKRTTARVLQAAAIFRGNFRSNFDFYDRHRTSTTLPPLTADFMKAAERQILQRIQLESFEEELQCLLNLQPISKKSRLIKLSPTLGEDNLIRLHGRIKVVEGVGQDVKTPVILDGRHKIVQLLVDYYHKKAGHANNELVVNELRQEFWILRLRSTVRTISSKCLICRIRKTKPLNPPTGDLPAIRLAHHRRPYTFTGLDYFGPILTTIGRRHEKRYVALYTCMTTRAVHLELVHSLSADAAIMSLRRFIARRGCPNAIYSDNGTAFVGANRILKEFYAESVTEFAANKSVKWKFIPAAAPSFGGCWERLVKTVKAPKEEILLTLLAEAEAIVNSRPLSHVSVDHLDDETLTPFHFLIGSSSNQTLPTT